MSKSTQPIALRQPPELSLLAHEGLLALAILSPELQQALLEDLQELVHIEQEFVAAQQVISHVDLSALAIAHHTIATADLLKLVHGWSEELEEFDRQRRSKYLETMHELVALAHAQVLGHLKGA